MTAGNKPMPHFATKAQEKSWRFALGSALVLLAFAAGLGAYSAHAQGLVGAVPIRTAAVLSIRPAPTGEQRSDYIVHWRLREEAVASETKIDANLAHEAGRTRTILVDQLPGSFTWTVRDPATRLKRTEFWIAWTIAGFALLGTIASFAMLRLLRKLQQEGPHGPLSGHELRALAKAPIQSESSLWPNLALLAFHGTLLSLIAFTGLLLVMLSRAPVIRGPQFFVVFIPLGVAVSAYRRLLKRDTKPKGVQLTDASHPALFRTLWNVCKRLQRADNLQVQLTDGVELEVARPNRWVASNSTAIIVTLGLKLMYALSVEELELLFAQRLLLQVRATRTKQATVHAVRAIAANMLRALQQAPVPTLGSPRQGPSMLLAIPLWTLEMVLAVTRKSAFREALNADRESTANPDTLLAAERVLLAITHREQTFFTQHIQPLVKAHLYAANLFERWSAEATTAFSAAELDAPVAPATDSFGAIPSLMTRSEFTKLCGTAQAGALPQDAPRAIELFDRTRAETVALEWMIEAHFRSTGRQLLKGSLPPQ